MINRQFIDVNNLTNGTTIETFSPCTLVINAGGYVSPDKIWKIVYSFGDGNSSEKILSMNPNSYNPSSPIPTEPGDPRNFSVENTYYFDDAVSKDFLITINFYTIGNSLPEIVSIILRLTLPKIDNIFEAADTIKLVGSRMFGLENQLVYVFESQRPNYLIPVLARF